VVQSPREMNSNGAYTLLRRRFGRGVREIRRSATSRPTEAFLATA